ncbi:MAG: hypothetical protein AAF384_07730 [Pseudomonadota bacterium]
MIRQPLAFALLVVLTPMACAHHGQIEADGTHRMDTAQSESGAEQADAEKGHIAHDRQSGAHAQDHAEESKIVPAEEQP